MFFDRGNAFYEAGNNITSLGNFDKAIQYFKQTADSKYYKTKILNEQGNKSEALRLVDVAIVDFNDGYYNNRGYVETLRQIYIEDLTDLKDSLTN